MAFQFRCISVRLAKELRKIIVNSRPFIITARIRRIEKVMFSVCSHLEGCIPVRFPVPSSDSGPRSFLGVPHHLVPCPFQVPWTSTGAPYSQDWVSPGTRYFVGGMPDSEDDFVVVSRFYKNILRRKRKRKLMKMKY